MEKTKNQILVEEIHSTFNTASEKMLFDALEILKQAGSGSQEKADRLIAAGFHNATDVQKWNAIKITKELADIIQRYQQIYPFNKFITEDQVSAICKKYKLLCAPIERYKGFVPETKLNQIEHFKINESDKKPSMVRIKSAWNSGTLLRSVCARNIHKKLGMKLIPANSPELYWQRTVLFSTKGQGSYIEKYDLIDNSKMLICAPAKDMDLKGLKKIGSTFNSFVTVTVPDPVVLQPCKGGFLIVAAWGDEASDPLVVNPINN